MRDVKTFVQPFSAGEISDASPSDIGPDYAALLENAKIRDGGISARHPYYGYNVQADIPANDEIFGAWVGYLQPFSNPGFAYYILTTEDGSILNYNYSLSNTPDEVDISASGNGGKLYPVAQLQNELILAFDDGRSPFIRYSGNVSAPSSASGTISGTAGQNTISGSSTNFLTEAPVGSYISVEDLSGTARIYRVTDTYSDTALTIEGVIPTTFSGSGWTSERWGVMGISNIVQEFTASSSSTTVTGAVPEFTGGGDNNNYREPLAVGDISGRKDDEDELRYIASSITAATYVLDSAPTSAYSSDFIRVTRNAFGRWMTFHRGRFWWAGLLNAPRHLCYSQPNGLLSEQFNGRDSKDVNFMRALTADFEIIGGEDGPGQITAIASTGVGPLLVWTFDEMFEVWGDPPGLTIRRVAYTGCLDNRAVVYYRGDIYWAARDGLWRWRGGQVENVSQLRTQRRWKELIPTSYDSGNFDTGDGVIGWLEDDVIVMCGEEESDAIAYDPIRDAWLGKWEYGVHTAGPLECRFAWNPIGLPERGAYTLDYLQDPMDTPEPLVVFEDTANAATTIVGPLDGDVVGDIIFRVDSGVNWLQKMTKSRITNVRWRYRIVDAADSATNPEIDVYYQGVEIQTLTETERTLGTNESYGSIYVRPDSSSSTPLLGNIYREHKFSFRKGAAGQDYISRFELVSMQVDFRSRGVRD